jgi:hypothetical protein
VRRESPAGGMRERTNRTVSKTVVSQGTVGSNPTPSAKCGWPHWVDRILPRHEEGHRPMMQRCAGQVASTWKRTDQGASSQSGNSTSRGSGV